MKLKVALALSLALAVAPFAAAGLDVAVPETPLARNYIVAFHALPEDRETYAGERVASVNEALAFFVVEARNPVGLQARAAADPNVRYVEEDLEQYHVTLTPNDTHYAKYQYSMKPATTNMEHAWDKSLGTTAVEVCVVDTGQYRAHQDFVGATFTDWKDFVNGKTAAYDDNGHGTHVTGTIGAVTNNANGVAGVAQASLSAAKVLAKSGSGTSSAVANGITFCADTGAHVISLSLGGGYSSTIENAINYAHNKGALNVAAAGNDGPCTNCVGYPAALPNAYAVACSNQNNAQCSFSSEGPQVDITAPGQDIPSTWPAGVYPCTQKSNKNCYVLSSGTSMSTPHVSGLAALVKGAFPSSTNADLRNKISSTAKDLGLSADEQGAGLIQGAAVY